jgi:hypothetical protein
LLNVTIFSGIHGNSWLFIDADRAYQKFLLKSKPLHGSHTGLKLNGVLLETLVDFNQTIGLWWIPSSRSSQIMLKSSELNFMS